MIPVAFDLRDPSRSGIARVALSLAQAFIRQSADRFDVTLCGPADRLEALGARTWTDGPVRLVPWGGGRLSAAAQLEWWRVRRAVGNAVWFFPHWDVPWYALPQRYVVMIHDLILLRVPGATTPVRRLVAARWTRRAVKHASLVAVGSEATRRDLAAFVPQTVFKTRWVPYGVDRRFFDHPPELPAECATFTARGPFMLSVGNRKRHKNLAMGVELLSRMGDLRWVVVGAWYPEWEQVAALAARAGVAGRTLVLPPQPDDVLRALYGRAACLFFPSRAEGFGLPVLEAIAAGTPVVCSNAGSLPEAAGSCATLCDPDDTDAFAAAVRVVLSNPRRQPPGCVERVREMSWAVSAKRLAGVLAEVGA